ncbi:hypothetical protein Salat_2756800 [Sesamum alatum]|uniref:DUF6821 domain-containing protein n=1 Tax=Sesamum alatum TaxID=300844 RepID=A0AAE1XL42_9LAMI|nr:hypothetical protein Salat_2756800 [Sesamum alatum]
MDTFPATNDFHDWELLQPNSDSDSAPHPNNSFDEIHSGGLIQVNYFSLDAQNRSAEDFHDDVSAGSDNPSWVDPGLEDNPTLYLQKDSGGGFWSDSSSEPSEDRKFIELDAVDQIGFSQNEKQKVIFDGIGEILEDKGDKAEDSGKFYMDSSGIQVGSAKLIDVSKNFQGESEVSGEDKNEIDKIVSGGEVPDDTGNKKNGELEKRSVVWWKMPMQFLKYCLFRMSPVWTVSMAAAVMGLVILGRRLHKMKKKTRGLEIKVTVDDKKISQVMSRAARLNEAFSVVKRVPMIRPSLPAVGTNTTWPAMSLR